MNRRENQFKTRLSKSKKILLVDDEKDLCSIMKEIIRDAGHRFLWATTVIEGLKKFKKSRDLDMVIVDLKLGHDNGLTFIRKAIAINNKVKFAMISAYGNPEVKDKARQLGVSRFLDKPLRLEGLLEIIKQN
ncbi:MAG: response regulator [Candidatus Omnitrophica bacterium]|nr:response regulator [Candidatus Omnitrophota bacterium]